MTRQIFTVHESALLIKYIDIYRWFDFGSYSYQTQLHLRFSQKNNLQETQNNSLNLAQRECHCMYKALKNFQFWKVKNKYSK